MPLPNNKPSFTFNHADQVDDYGRQVGDSSIVKSNFDSRAEEMRVFANQIVDTLGQTTNSDSGADNIAITSIPEISAATNTQQALEAIVAAGLGNIPPANSITPAQLVPTARTRVNNVGRYQSQSGFENVSTVLANVSPDGVGRLGTRYFERQLNQDSTSTVTATAGMGERFSSTYTTNMDDIDAVQIFVSEILNSRGNLRVSVYNNTLSSQLAFKDLSAEDINVGQFTRVQFDSPINIPSGHTIHIRMIATSTARFALRYFDSVDQAVSARVTTTNAWSTFSTDLSQTTMILETVSDSTSGIIRRDIPDEDIETYGNMKVNVSGLTSSNSASVTIQNYTEDDISKSTYDNISFSVAGQETSPRSLFFKKDKTKVYVIGTTSDRVRQYSLSNPNLISTMSYDGISYSVAAQAPFPLTLWISDDEDRMYVLNGATGSNPQTLLQYNIPNINNISTMSYANKSFAFTDQGTSPKNFDINKEETVLFYLDNTGDTIHQYDFRIPGDISTLSYSGKNFSTSNEDTSPDDIKLSRDGTKLYILGDSGDNIYQYDFETPLDISTLRYSGKSTPVDANPTQTAFAFDADYRYFYTIDISSDRIYQYSANDFRRNDLLTQNLVNGENLIELSSISASTNSSLSAVFNLSRNSASISSPEITIPSWTYIAPPPTFETVIDRDLLLDTTLEADVGEISQDVDNEKYDKIIIYMPSAKSADTTVGNDNIEFRMRFNNNTTSNSHESSYLESNTATVRGDGETYVLMPAGLAAGNNIGQVYIEINLNTNTGIFHTNDDLLRGYFGNFIFLVNEPITNILLFSSSDDIASGTQIRIEGVRRLG